MLKHCNITQGNCRIAALHVNKTAKQGTKNSAAKTKALAICTKKQTEELKGKGKAVPLLAWSGPEGSRKLRFPDFMIRV